MYLKIKNTVIFLMTVLKLMMNGYADDVKISSNAWVTEFQHYFHQQLVRVYWVESE